MILVKLSSKGPVFYGHTRFGRGGRPFKAYKFRSMVPNGDEVLRKHLAENAAARMEWAANQKLKCDPRVTAVGRFLRVTSLDELPQLWNVIRGEMSLVGPRPEDPSFVGVHPAGYAEILRIRPGIAGLAQLVYARESRLLDGPELLQHYIQSLLPHKVAIDCLYVARRSIGLDVRILLWTLLVLFGIPAAVDPITARPYRPSQQEREPLPAAIQETSI
jgi:exopolysaccharide production protein ExoY